MVHASSFVIGAARLSAGLVLTIVIFFPRIDFGRLWPWSKVGAGTAERYLLPTIGLLFGIHWYTYFESIQRSSATLGILALSTYGIHVTWMGALFSARRPSPRDWMGVAVAICGAWLCLPAIEVNASAFWGFVLGMVSAVFYAAIPLLHQRIAHVSHSTRAAGQFLFAWLLFLPSVPSQSWSLSSQDWWLLAILGVLCTFVAHNLWISITTEVRPATSGMLYYLSLPVTIGLETLLLQRPPTYMQLTGAALILLGNGFALWSRATAASRAMVLANSPPRGDGTIQ